MTRGRAGAEQVDVHLSFEPHPSPAQQRSWDLMWRRLLAPSPDSPTRTDNPEEG
jgi:hypothetical protein